MTNPARGIQDKQRQPRSRADARPPDSLGASLQDAEAALTDLKGRDAVGRIWRRDHTLWKPDPAEIADRLGWLQVTDMMGGQVAALEAFAAEVRAAGFRHAVLLGMGGSSLGPEVLRQTFGSAAGYPELMVLDSTVPDAVGAAEGAIDPAQTLFLVSSKSGTTIEPNALYRRFRVLVEDAVGKQAAPSHFVAITDPGTPLERMAHVEGFRRVFANPPDIGGRFSVLSYFGLVPAALMGVNVATLLERADCMREACAASVPANDNPGAWLGAVMGALAQRGRDKLTLVTSPSIASFGLWVEQLIAESTGKEGRGIVPVASEPLSEPGVYGDDRFFVYLRVQDDDNGAPDAAMESIRAAGHPTVLLGLQDRYDLGAEFFRWEFATAAAGAVIGIQPFDQPNVLGAKDQTDQVLQEYESSGQLTPTDTESSLRILMAHSNPGDYAAIMAYIRPTAETDRALAHLRGSILTRHRVATTAGYGPRFLHSTGQLHKGGPPTGVFLQLVGEHAADLPIPGAAYTFGVLADAQALGDLRVLQGLGRPVARITLGSDHASDIMKLAAELE